MNLRSRNVVLTSEETAENTGTPRGLYARQTMTKQQKNTNGKDSIVERGAPADKWRVS